MSFSAALVLPTLLVGLVALWLWVTGRDGLAPKQGAALPLTLAVVTPLGLWSASWTLWLANDWLDWGWGGGHVLTPGVLLGIVFILAVLATLPVALALSILWLRRVPMVWILWIAACPTLSVFWWNRHSGVVPTSWAFIASLVLLELSLYALARIAFSMLDPRWRRAVAAAPRLDVSWPEARARMGDVAALALRGAAGLTVVAVIALVVWTAHATGPTLVQLGGASDPTAKAEAAICDDFPVSDWRIVPNFRETDTYLLEVTVHPRRTSPLRLGPCFLYGADTAPVMRDRPDQFDSAADAARAMVPVERRAYVTLRRVLEPTENDSRAVLADFALCTAPESDHPCGWFRYGGRKRFPGLAGGCRLPAPVEVPGFVTLAESR